MSEQRLKEAFDQIAPSDEAKRRMLNGILVAAEKMAVEQTVVESTIVVEQTVVEQTAVDGVIPEQTGIEPVAVKPVTPKQVLLRIEPHAPRKSYKPRKPRQSRKPRKPSRLLAFSLPIACGLIILATMGALIVPQLLSAPPTSVSEAPQTGSPTSPGDATTEEPAIDEPLSNEPGHEDDEGPASTGGDSEPMPDASSPALTPAYDYAPSASTPLPPASSLGKAISVVLAIALPVLTAVLLGIYALLRHRKARTARKTHTARTRDPLKK